MSVFWTVKNSGEPGVSPFKRGSLSQRSMVGRRMVRAGARAIKPQSKGFRALHPQAAPASCGRQMSFLPLVRIWIWVSVLASVAGWLLSALGQLNRIGYGVFAAAVAVGLGVRVCLRRLRAAHEKKASNLQPPTSNIQLSPAAKPVDA